MDTSKVRKTIEPSFDTCPLKDDVKVFICIYLQTTEQNNQKYVQTYLEVN